MRTPTPKDLETVGTVIRHPRRGQFRVVGVYDTDRRTGKPVSWEIQNHRGVTILRAADLPDWRLDD